MKAATTIIWCIAVLILFAGQGLSYLAGRKAGFRQGVAATIPEASKQCAILTVATFRSASRMLEAKNRQAELEMQRAARR